MLGKPRLRGGQTQWISICCPWGCSCCVSFSKPSPFRCSCFCGAAAQLPASCGRSGGPVPLRDGDTGVPSPVGAQPASLPPPGGGGPRLGAPQLTDPLPVTAAPSTTGRARWVLPQHGAAPRPAPPAPAEPGRRNACGQSPAPWQQEGFEAPCSLPPATRGGFRGGGRLNASGASHQTVKKPKYEVPKVVYKAFNGPKDTNKREIV